MSCNTLCPCISSVWEQYFKILHNMHFDHVIWHHNAFWLDSHIPYEVFCGWYCLRNRNKANKGLEKQVWLLFKLKNIKLNFCCYHVQISLIMSQHTQSDIFLWVHCTRILTETIKIYQEKIVGLKKIQSWYCHILYLKSTNWCMMKFFIATHFIFIYDFIIIGNMLFNVFLQ
jgi:hypothetical protein